MPHHERLRIGVQSAFCVEHRPIVGEIGGAASNHCLHERRLAAAGTTWDNDTTPVPSHGARVHEQPPLRVSPDALVEIQLERPADPGELGRLTPVCPPSVEDVRILLFRERVFDLRIRCARRLRAWRQEVSHGIEPIEIRRPYRDSNPQALEGESAQPLDTVEIEHDLLLRVAGRASLSSRRSVAPRGPPKVAAILQSRMLLAEAPHLKRPDQAHGPGRMPWHICCVKSTRLTLNADNLRR